jgi:hypothetical protein
MNHRIHDIPEQDRPRERLLRLGPGVLSDAELLAIFINTGTKGENAIQVAQRLLREVGTLRDLSRQEPESLVRNRALGPAKAANLAAAFDPGMFVIGGGVSAAGELLLGPARETYQRQLTGRGYRPLAQIVAASLGNDAGVIGAADLAREAHSAQPLQPAAPAARPARWWRRRHTG